MKRRSRLIKPRPFLCTFILASTLVLPGCGKKGKPMAPVTVVPEKIANFIAHPRGNAIILSWPIPQKNTDGSPLRDLKGFKILRSEIDLEDGCLECPKRFSQRYDIDYKTYLMNNPNATTVQFLDSDLRVKTIYTYRVVSYNMDHNLSPPSNTQEICWDLPSLPPRGLHGELEGKAVILYWEEPPSLKDGSPLKGLVGYTLYRREPHTSYPPIPLNEEIIPTSGCRDRGIEMGRDYFYTVRAVRKVKDTFIESEESEEAYVNTTDRTPPSPPSGLVAVSSRTGVILKWDANKESDLKGYNIYRREEGENDFVPLNPTLIPSPGYTDRAVEKGKSYTYTITAVDDAPQANESQPSAEVTLRHIF